MIDEIVDALAVARITRLVVEDRVPFGWLRARILKAEKRRIFESHECEGDLCTKHPGHFESTYVEELLSCAWCASIWVGLLVLVARRLPGWRSLARVLAASEISGLLAAYVER